MRRTGLTFAPEAGSWRLRQVINKLILEDDLYSAVDAAYSQGWRRVKLYFLTGLPTEMDEDTLGIAELAKNVVDDRPQVHEAGELHGVGRRLRAEAAHAVPVVRPERRSTSCGARSRCCATRYARDARAGEVARPGGDVRRGHREPRRPPHRTRSSSACGARGGTFQEWSEHFALDRWLDAMDAEGLDPDWYVTRHRTLDEVLPWDHITAGLHKDFLWQDWQAALAEHGLPDCRWTPCYDCGVCTDYALEHVVASPVPPGRREPGHRPGPRRGERGPTLRCRFLGIEPDGAGGGDARRRGLPGARSAVHEAGQGPLGSRTATSPGRSSGRSGSPSSRSRSPQGFSPRPKVSFGLALSTGHESDAEYLDLEFARRGRRSRTLPESLTAALPEGMDVTGAARSSSGRRRCKKQ